MVKSSLCDYSDEQIFVKGTITVQKTTSAAESVSNTDTQVIFSNCDSFIDCFSEINNAQVDNAKDTDVAMTIY